MYVLVALGFISIAIEDFVHCVWYSAGFVVFIWLVFDVYGVQFLNCDEPVLDYVRRIEFDTLFFLGVLLLVGVLKELGILGYSSQLYDNLAITGANCVSGVVSALLDKVPLTSALLNPIPK